MRFIAYFTNWFIVRYEEKLYICYVLYMVCTVFVKNNQTCFTEDLLV